MSNRFITVLHQMGGKVMLSGFVLIGLLILIGYIGKSVNFEEQFQLLSFSTNPQAAWYQGPVGYVLLGTLSICVGCPRQIVSFFSAYFFGLWVGVAAALVASAFACVVSFTIARIFQGTFRSLIRGKLDVAVRFWKDNAFFASMIWRFMPVGSNLLTNWAAGALGIPAIGFFLGSAIGYIPQTVIFAIVGSGVKLESGTQLTISVVLFVVSALMGLALYARYRNKLRETKAV